MLFYASDAVVLPYKITSGSGVMFDALSHTVPFVFLLIWISSESLRRWDLELQQKGILYLFARAIDNLGKMYR